MPYQDYLKSEQWQETKRRYYEFFPRECAFCGSKKRIHLHHRRYSGQYGNILGIESLKDLIALCASCHAQWHAIHGHYFMHRFMETTIKDLLWIGFSIKAAMHQVKDINQARRYIRKFKEVNGIRETPILYKLDPNERAYRLIR